MKSKTKIEAIFMVMVIAILAFFAAQQAYISANDIPNSIATQYKGNINNAVPIKVDGAQWSWTFTYQNGTTSVDNLTLKPNTTYQLIVTSSDVIHDLYIIHLGTQVYAVPGRTNTITFTTPSTPGTYHFECVEYCGLDHYLMRGVLTVT